MTVYQGKAKKNLFILHSSITVVNKTNKIPESDKAYNDKNMVLILLIKWPGNIRLEPPPAHGLCIRFITHWTWWL